MQLLLSTICLALTSAVIGNAYYQKKQFYPAVVYVTKSNASMAVIYIQFFVIVFMFGKLLRKIFLGTLRAAEFEHLLERFWYALTETCLAFTVFRDDFNPRFVALFTVLLFLKSFHWLAEERVDFMERSPVLGWIFHIRVASLLFILGLFDYLLFMHAYNSTLERGPTVQLVFGFEYGILLTVITSTTIKYVLHAAEMRTDTPWENKAVFLLYTELVIGFIKVVLYVLFVVIMAKIYALPMFVFRPMFFTIRNFKKALSDVIMSRRAIRNMNTLYPDATPEELRLSDNICIICREDMVNHSKKLPCGHIFHTTCLRSWFQRQQTCPTCRLNILRTPGGVAGNGPQRGAAAARQDDGAPPAGVQQQANNIAAAAANLQNVGTPNASRTPAPSTTANTNTPGSASANSENIVPPPPFAMPNLFNMPPFPTSMQPGAHPLMMPPPPLLNIMTPFPLPPPPMPNDLTTYTDDELRAMEGSERKKIEERLKLLQNINLMLDAAGLLMQNYQIVAARSNAAQLGQNPQTVNITTTPLASEENAPTAGSSTNLNSTNPTSSASSLFPNSGVYGTTLPSAQPSSSSSSTKASGSAAADNKNKTVEQQQTAVVEDLVNDISDHKQPSANKAASSSASSDDAASSLRKRDDDNLTISKTKKMTTSSSLGAQAIRPSSPSSEANIRANKDENSSELSELRERRLKYLDECRKQTATEKSANNQS